MNELHNISKLSENYLKKVPEIIAQTMRDALTLVGQTSVTKYMITTKGIRQRKGVSKNVSSPIDPVRLTMRSARLARSLTRAGDAESIRKLEIVDGKIIGTLGTRVPYAKIHEIGGTIPAHIIRTRTARALHFVIDGRDIFVKQVYHPGSVMPARPFLRPALGDSDVRQGISKLYGSRMRTELAASMKTVLGAA